MTLFVNEPFVARSGSVLDWKIDCDALTDSDLATLAQQVAGWLSFSCVVGVPRGGLRFAAALELYLKLCPHPTVLIVDDVLTTGQSMEKMKARFPAYFVIGVVIFARGMCPGWVKPIFQLGLV